MCDTPDDTGSTAWRIWDALVNRNGLPLALTADELLQLTEREALTLQKIAQRKGAIIEFSLEGYVTTIRFPK